MPPLIGAALIATASALELGGAAGILGTTVVAGLNVATIIGYGITTLATIGAQFAFSRAQANKHKTGDLQITSVTIKQPIPTVVRAYGQVQIAGALFYEDAIPIIYQPLVLGQIHCEGPISRYVGYKLNDAWTGVNAAAGVEPGGVNLALPWGTLIGITGHLGTDTQTADSQLAATRGWTQPLKGLAYSVMVCQQPPGRPDKYFQYFYPNGVPTLKAVINASLVFDPRDSTVKFSRNPALIIRDFLIVYKTDSSGRHIPRGMGLPASRINNASFAAFANMCDEVYQSKYSINPSDGNVITTLRNEPRYQCDGYYQLDEAPTDVLNRMLATCDATLFTDSDGLVSIRGGSYQEPTVLINDDMIIACDLSKGGGKFEAFNRLKISLTAPHMDYQLVDGSPWDDSADIADNGVLVSELSLPWVQSYSQARRLAKISMAKGNPEWHYNTMTCTLAALNVLGEEFVHVTHSLPGIDGPFMVHSVKLMFDRGQVELQLSSIDPGCYNWDPNTEDAPPPSVNGVTGGGTSGSPPGG